MRKNLILIAFVSLSTTAFAQFKLGFQFSPILSTNRVDLKSTTTDLDSDGTALRLAVGPIVDVQLTENYYFSSGILFCSKRAGFESRVGANPPIKEDYNLQYVQVPISMKLFTNEVALDKKIYFQVGGAFEFNVKEEANNDNNVLIEDFRLFDASLLAGLGLEYKIGTSTLLFGGFSYHRGLVNAVSKHIDVGGDIKLKNDYIAIDFGVKF
jgi:hypothetical protein